MNKPLSPILADRDHPILFRTVNEFVFKSTLETGSVWLRSDQYYRRIEDKVRQDSAEGLNGGLTALPLRLSLDRPGSEATFQGGGKIGQFLPPHYILSLHGSSISPGQHASFGGFTLGVKSIIRLAEDIYEKAKKVIGEHQWFCGHVAYQRAALMLTVDSRAPVIYGLDAPLAIAVYRPAIMRKDPVWPFIEQDEWRIVLFPEQYLDNDPDTPIRLTVDPNHFYPYLQPASQTNRPEPP